MQAQRIDYPAEARRIGNELQKTRPGLIGAYDGLLLCEAADELDRLRAAIRKHRDEKGDSRCWLDDAELYASLVALAPVETALPPKCEFLESCSRFWEQRQSPDEKAAAGVGGGTIAQLEAEIGRLCGRLEAMEDRP